MNARKRGYNIIKPLRVVINISIALQQLDPGLLGLRGHEHPEWDGLVVIISDVITAIRARGRVQFTAGIIPPQGSGNTVGDVRLVSAQSPLPGIDINPNFFLTFSEPPQYSMTGNAIRSTCLGKPMTICLIFS